MSEASASAESTLLTQLLTGGKTMETETIYTWVGIFAVVSSAASVLIYTISTAYDRWKFGWYRNQVIRLIEVADEIGRAYGDEPIQAALVKQMLHKIARREIFSVRRMKICLTIPEPPQSADIGEEH